MPKAAGRVELAPLEVFDQGIAEDAVPSIEVGQLLRSLPQPREEAGDAQKSTAGAAVLAVRAGDRDGGSAGRWPGATAVGWSAPRDADRGRPGGRIGSTNWRRGQRCGPSIGSV